MLPAAKAVPKELLPVLDRPTIQYVFEEAADAGVRDVLLVSSPAKRAVEEHFVTDGGLEDRLRRNGREKLLESVHALMRRLRVYAVDQVAQRGLGDAVQHARDHMKNEPFLCLLGDTIFSGQSPSQQLCDAYQEFGTAVIGLEEVPEEKVGRYGIVGGTPVRDGIFRIETLVEKPSLADAPSRLAIAARYVLTPAVFNCIDRVKPDAKGEIQLTDALRFLLEREAIHGVVLRGKRHDIGNPIDWLKTNIFFASRDEATWSQIEPLLKSLLDRAQ